jgi:hypothetical protein
MTMRKSILSRKLVLALIHVVAGDATAEEREEACVMGDHRSIDWAAHKFHPVVHLPSDYTVMDLTQGPSAHGYGISDNVSYVCKGFRAGSCRRRQWGVGRWCEHRPNMYGGSGTIFDDSANCLEGYCGSRVVHMAIDLGGPVGTPVHAFWDGWIEHVGFQEPLGDTGHTLVTGHTLNGTTVYALVGHLSASSMAYKRIGMPIRRGEVIGWMGDALRRENGGWPPHIHFQLAMQRPKTHDLPGVVALADVERAKDAFPDPRLVLGPLYSGGCAL